VKVAYIASRYPHISHTFIRREVEALRAEGVEVHTFTVRSSEAEAHFGPADREAERTTTAILPISPVRLVRIQLAALRRSPDAYLRTLLATVRGAPVGLRSWVWALFYFLEGTVLWWHCDRRGVRHIHAHFANVGAEVARVATRFGRGADGVDSWSWSFTMHGSAEFYEMTGFDVPGKAGDADAVICISHYTRSQLVMWTDPPAWSRFHIVHCGVDVHEFTLAPVDTGPHPLRLLFLGRLMVGKGLVVLVEALGLLRFAGVEAELTIVGEGPARPEIERTIAQLGLRAHVTLLGAVAPEEARSHYHRADVFCLPSFAEGVPVVLMEAMSCGLPVVTTYITGIPELVTDGVEGHTVTPGRADLVAEALRKLSDPARRRAMGEAGRTKVEREFDIATVGPQLVAVFEALPGT
jgi:colanic acid/amylovoran biosynthesis glycosyltransferase